MQYQHGKLTWGVIPLAEKGHVMQHRLTGDRIRIFTQTKMQIRSKAEESQKRSFSHDQNVLILATSHHALPIASPRDYVLENNPLKFFETMFDDAALTERKKHEHRILINIQHASLK